MKANFIHRHVYQLAPLRYLWSMVYISYNRISLINIYLNYSYQNEFNLKDSNGAKWKKKHFQPKTWIQTVRPRQYNFYSLRAVWNTVKLILYCNTAKAALNVLLYHVHCTPNRTDWMPTNSLRFLGWFWKMSSFDLPCDLWNSILRASWCRVVRRHCELNKPWKCICCIK